jgi:hypothetical protein
VDAIPAWLVALVALAASVTILNGSEMPLPLRIALAAPRLACFALYAIYALFDMDIQNRVAITRILLLYLLLTELLAAPLLRRVHHRRDYVRY